MTPAMAEAAAKMVEAQGLDEDNQDDDEQQADITPEQIAANLPAGVSPVPADWPDPDAWPNGLPPANWPTGADPNVWPNPDGARPSGWTDYQWQRYQYNWKTYRSSYQ